MTSESTTYANYELSSYNHLGNVRAVVSDVKVPTVTGGAVTDLTADVVSATDYYPFGMQMPGRSFSSNAYRYGFQGQEKDDEIKGEGNSYDFGARIQDPTLGRFLSVDKAFRLAKTNARRLKREIVSYRNAIFGNSYNPLTGSVVAPDVRSLPVIAGGRGLPSHHEDHFDGMNYSQIVDNYKKINSRIDSYSDRYEEGSITPGMLGEVVGEAFHAIQDLYSHSNYIELYEEMYGQTELDEIPTFDEALTLDKYQEFAGVLKDRLITGSYPGTVEGSHQDLNHDIGAGSMFEYIGGALKEIRGKEVTWNSRAAEAVATKATVKLNDKVEEKINNKK